MVACELRADGTAMTIQCARDRVAKAINRPGHLSGGIGLLATHAQLLSPIPLRTTDFRYTTAINVPLHPALSLL
jgi:hypothetical protein